MKTLQMIFLVFAIHTSSFCFAEPIKKTWSAWQDRDSWVMGASVAGILSAQLAGSPTSAAWNSPILFDEGVRNAFRRQTYGSREGAALWSDWLRNVAILSPFLLDSFGLQFLRDGVHRGALRTSLVAIEALSVTLFLAEVTKRVTARARPNSAECAADPTYADNCTSNDQNQSFFSGHVASAFVGAALVCRNHQELELFDGSTLDSATCASAISVAVATSYFRIAADRHYATDVSMGALVGFSVGYFLPTLLHHAENKANSTQSQSMVLPLVAQDKLGLSYLMRF